MKLKILVLAKQVPDTRNVGKDAMKADGTVNRSALPAIFNPEDLNALEQALRVKDTYPESTVTILTMGPARASEIIKESIFRGADNGFVLSGREFAGSDTLATSYALSCAIRKIGPFDIIFGGRQAIDGDTAQVGPQVAEKLGLSQITYAEKIEQVDDKTITVLRRLEHGVELVKGQLPIVITVNGSAADCRPRHAKRTLQYKRALSTSMVDSADEATKAMIAKHSELVIPEITPSEIDHKPEWLGLSGSPTKVKSIQSVVFTAKEATRLGSTDGEIDHLMKELIANHTIG